MNQKFNLKANNFIKNMLRYSYLIIMALLLNAVVNEIIVSANKIISVNIDFSSISLYQTDKQNLW